MKKSAFQFTAPTTTKLEFEINKGFAKGQTVEMRMDISVQIEPNDTDHEIPENTARVSITLVLGEKNDTAPFYVEAVEEAYFRWESDRFTEEERKVLLEKNAVSLLISYLRPIVSGITAASPYPAYNIPYVDLTAND